MGKKNNGRIWNGRVCTGISKKAKPELNVQFAKLCSAIIDSGKEAKDERFLNSEWYKTLEDFRNDMSKSRNCSYSVSQLIRG